MKNFHIIIPARLNSSRFPGKLLHNIIGKPMILHTVECACCCIKDVKDVIVATDNIQIYNVVVQHGAAKCIMTSSQHKSGTDRLAEVVKIQGWSDSEIIVNLQGDEPFIPTVLLSQVASNLYKNPIASIATLCTPIKNREELFNPDVVKVTKNIDSFAHYFSRAPIPWHRDAFSDGLKKGSLPKSFCYYRHLGLYAYRAGFLKRFQTMSPAPTEKVESLEQLRALWHNEKIHVDITTKYPMSIGIDTKDDLRQVELRMQGILNNE